MFRLAQFARRCFFDDRVHREYRYELAEDTTSSNFANERKYFSYEQFGHVECRVRRAPLASRGGFHNVRWNYFAHVESLMFDKKKDRAANSKEFLQFSNEKNCIQ